MKYSLLLISMTFYLISCSKDSDNESLIEQEKNEDITIGLKKYAIEKGKFIGNLMRDGMFDNLQVYNGSTDNILKTDYNAIVLGNKMKMSNLLRTRPQDPFNVKIEDINTGIIDKFVDYADKNNMRKRGHVMIWYKQIPTWLKNEAPNWSCLLYTSPSPRDGLLSRMPSSA